MKPDIKTYHFTNPSNEKILKFVEKICDLNTILCFDLEDFTKDVLDKKVEKNLHRQNVINTVQIISDSFFKQKIGLRINVNGTDEFYEDLNLIESVKNKVTFECIYLPKVEDGEEILKCIEMLKRKGIEFFEIIPIIESKKAYNNLPNIIYSSPQVVKKFAFGHCDYNYDTGNFPFFHQNSEKYWEWIDFIVGVLKVNDIVFVNSPYLFLDDEAGFLGMISRLSQKTNGIFGQVTLSLNQVEQCLFCKYYSTIQAIATNKLEIIHNKKEIAKMIIKDYEENLSNYRSFSINKDRFFISPQEYLAAKRYLKTFEVCDVS